MADDPKKPYGDVEYADPGYQADDKKRYPLDSEEHCRAAWSYIHQADNAAKYTAEQLAAIKGRILAAGKRYGIEFNDEPERSRPSLGMCVRAFNFETRTAGDGRTLEGYAAVYNTPARIADLSGDFDEVIMPGAFARSLRTRTPVMQWEHGQDPRVGRVPIAAIEDLREDDRGLHVRARLYDNETVEPIRQAIAGKSVNGMSFRFSVATGGDRWTRNAGQPDRREVRDADVYELGPVVHPAYDTTSVSVRSLLAQLDPAEHRALLRALAAHLGLAADLPDFTGRPDARSAGGGDSDARPGNGRVASPPSVQQRLDADSLRIRGILT